MLLWRRCRMTLTQAKTVLFTCTTQEKHLVYQLKLYSRSNLSKSLSVNTLADSLPDNLPCWGFIFGCFSLACRNSDTCNIDVNRNSIINLHILNNCICLLKHFFCAETFTSTLSISCLLSASILSSRLICFMLTLVASSLAILGFLTLHTPDHI